MKQLIFDRIRIKAINGINISLVIISELSSSPLILCAHFCLMHLNDFFWVDKIVNSLVTNSTLVLIHSSFSNGLFKRDNLLNSRNTG